jgi:hypothetical protein
MSWGCRWWTCEHWRSASDRRCEAISVKIVFSTTSFGFLRNFQWTIRRLADRGHTIHLLAERGDAVDGQKMASALVADYPSAITSGFLSANHHRIWHSLGMGLRASLDYWRYLDERWHESPKLRARAARLAPAAARAVPRIPLLGSRTGLALLQRLFRALDRVLPCAPDVVAFFERERPDLLLLTPLLYFGSHQVDHVRCARRLGIPSVVGIGSWDHLTTKGLLHEIPDRVLVWNEAQKEEAIELHGVAAGRVLVTGAQAYDHWFTMQPSADRAGFCHRVGLDPDRPLLLYLCSSSFIAPYEVGFVRRWAAAIRASGDERLKSAGLLVRPHPQNADQWRDVELGQEFGNAAVYPKAGVNPIGGAERADYFDSMYHAEAVVGVNTSGMIESGIVGRPVFAVQVEEFRATQDGTLHFRHLKNVEGGLLHLASTVEEHVDQIERSLADPERARRRARGFIQAFVRPHGLNASATERVVDELEAFARLPAPVPVPVSFTTRVGRVVLAPLAVVVMFAASDREKWRYLLIRLTRPVRDAIRPLRSWTRRALRFFRWLPRLTFRLGRRVVRAVFVRPAQLVAHRTRPVIRRLGSAGVHTSRWVRRYSKRAARAARRAVRLGVVRPAQWARRRGRFAAHAVRSWRRRAADEADERRASP